MALSRSLLLDMKLQMSNVSLVLVVCLKPVNLIVQVVYIIIIILIFEDTFE